jgi:GNAT superfamily N-acetyltransferase
MTDGARGESGFHGKMKFDAKAGTLRPASTSDLPAVNGVIESAIDTWQIPERVKRLCIPLYHYSAHDLAFLELVVVEIEDIGIVGVAAWDRADPGETPGGQSALLLHGIYVAPAQHRRGVGTCLFEAAVKAASSRGLDGVLVKAQPGAEQFFTSLGLQRLAAVDDASRDYPYRFWKALRGV